MPEYELIINGQHVPDRILNDRERDALTEFINEFNRLRPEGTGFTEAVIKQKA